MTNPATNQPVSPAQFWKLYNWNYICPCCRKHIPHLHLLNQWSADELQREMTTVCPHCQRNLDVIVRVSPTFGIKPGTAETPDPEKSKNPI